MDIHSILEQIPKEMARRESKKVELQVLFGKHKEQLVIYGHGNLGVNLEQGLRHAGWRIQYFLDANKPTDLIKKNINLKDASRYIDRDALIIVALYDIVSSYSPIRSAIQEAGYDNIISVLDLRVWPELFQAGHLHNTLSWDIEHLPEEQLSNAYSILADASSKKVFMELLHFMTDNPYGKMTLCPADEQYIPRGSVYLPSQEEHIVDCGAFDGDTMRSFLSKIGTWRSYTAVDADPYNIEKVRDSIKRDLPANLQKVTRAVHVAVSNERGMIAFQADNRTSSHVVENSLREGQTISVPVAPLDELIKEPVTLLKMDVEGFELRALQGAKGLIQANKPLLAICGYHRQEDLWEIPLYMKSLLPDHQIYLRNYLGIIEYVFYAIPKDRVIPK